MAYEDLTGKRKLFVDHYLGQANCNKSEAARLAGYACPGSEGHRLYKDTDIREAIEERLREVAIGADEILARLSEQARADMADFVSVEEGGGFRITLEAAERAGKLRLVKKIGFDQKGRPLLELHDSQSALLAMAKRYRLFPDRQELTGADGRPVQVGLTHAELLEAAREPLEPELEVVPHPHEVRGAVGL